MTTIDTEENRRRENARARFRAYGDVIVYTAVLTLSGRYGGQSQQGQHRAMVVWVRRDGRWQQVASQLTPILTP